ncbi:hypothetical protein V9T40_007835 [Parthenolecanium corni]|uniref:CRAL-TRIO domain-containing protein n=1 Tax=Parthenolecanium corni TaxID=536013 RepID=A0AAN9TID4_9HEMI
MKSNFEQTSHEIEGLKTLRFAFGSVAERLRGSRSRKNGPSGRRGSNARKPFKSSNENEFCHAVCKCAPFPLYFTVDDLAALRRKRVPPKYLDSLRPLCGSFANVCSEYRSAYRWFIIAPADDSIMNWKKKKMKPLDCAPAQAQPLAHAHQDEQAQLPCKSDLPAGEQFIRHPRRHAIRPADNFGGCADDDSAFSCNASSEAKDKYVMYAHAKPASLKRQPTHLKMEGEFDGASEMKDKYTAHSGASKAHFRRRHTQQQLEGVMQLTSESATSFVRLDSAQRARLQRRHTTLELPGDCACVYSSEYHHAFRNPEHYERAHLMRSLENLRTDGEMQFRPEYACSFVDHRMAYPQVRYRERRHSLVEAHQSRQQQQCELKTVLKDRAVKASYSPEYRHSYVRFPAHRPTLQRPHTHLIPPPGIGETESESKSQLREVWLPKSAGAQRLSATSKAVDVDGCDTGAGRSRSRGSHERQEGKENRREKPFCVLPEIGSEAEGKNVNFTENIPSRPSESAFRKGKRLPTAKCCSETEHSRSSNSEANDLKRPTYRLEVTNPDHKQNAFEKQRSGNAPFVVLDENNNANQWIKNKQTKKRWTPSWMKVVEFASSTMSSYEIPVSHLNPFSQVVSYDYDTLVKPPPKEKLDQADAVDEIRRLLGCRNKSVFIPELEDDFILRFLRARKMDVERSYQLLVNYFAFRQNNAALFKGLNIDDQLIMDCIRDGLPMVFKNKDRKGRSVIFFVMYQWDRTKYTFETLYRSLVLSLEYLLSEETNQLFGFVFVVDWTGFTLRDYIDISPKMLKMLVDGFQDSFPARIRNVHFVGQPWYVNGILAVVKPFLKDKMKDKLIIHSSNLSTLHEYIPPDVVSAELGGEGDAHKPDEWIESLRNYEKRLLKTHLTAQNFQKSVDNVVDVKAIVMENLDGPKMLIL